MSAQFKATAGSVGAPSITFTSDVATGIYLPASHQLGASANGTLGWILSTTAFTMSLPIVFGAEVSVTSATSTLIFAATSQNVLITGTTTITSFDATVVGAFRLVRFNAALTLTSGASILGLPQTIMTAAGDTAYIRSEGSSVARVLWYKAVASTAPLLIVGQAAGNLVALDAQASLQNGIATPVPQGRLTLTSGTPVLAADASATASVFYTPYLGNLVSIYNGTYYQNFAFAELTLSLANAAYTGNAVVDVFLFLNSGVVTIGSGPIWSVAGNFVRTTSLTTGTAARGTGAGTTQLSRLLGLLTNTVAMTARNGGTTYSVAANQGTYVGSVWIDAAGQATTCHVTAGQNRVWSVFNMYNRVPTILTEFDSTASWTWNSATFHAANATAANSISVLSGVAEEWLDAVYTDVALGSNNGVTYRMGIGLGSTSTQSGSIGLVQPNNAGTQYIGSAIAHASNAPFIGMQAVVALEAVSSGTGTFNGTQANMEMRAVYRS